MNWFEKCKCGEFAHTNHICKYNNKDLMIKELEKAVSELTGSLSLALDSKRKNLYIKEINETLLKYLDK